jgi:aryl-alcohol dehydrogenase-like predicted oxidoreductase
MLWQSKAAARLQISFTRARLGGSGREVCRLGLSASYRPGKETIHKALDAGVNYFFCYGFDTQMTGVLRDLPRSDRERIVIATGAYNYVWTRQDLRRTLEKRLRQLRTDYLDVFHFLGVMRRNQFEGRVQDDLIALRENPRVGAVSISCHDRAFAGELAARGSLDALMIRYNAAHRGAEREIFPLLAAHQPGLISYTATRWGALLRTPRGWKGRTPTAAMCYRFVLSNSHVDVCLTAPSNKRQLEENLTALRDGPLDEEEMAWMRTFGDAVHARQRWFL